MIAKINTLFGSQFMYSDDPENLGPEERSITTQINEFRNQFAGQEFGLIQTQQDIYKVFNKDRKIEGTINLRSKYADIRQHD